MPVNPLKYFFKINGKYETAYKYYIVHPSGKTEEISDTTNLGLDIVREFSNQHILIGKDNKYGLYDIRPETKIVLTPQAHSDYRALARAAFLKTIQTKYDEVRFEKQAGREVNYAEVRVKDKWGVIDSRGNEVLGARYDRLAIEPGRQMALIEFEPNRLGYKHFNGTEYFKRKK
ncbi:MAG: WG repeat-containing protein [Thermoanaerobaculia bacterium]|nr:WG repeat-containing protein [Thermoanaerobaculia bacterium]